MTVELVHDCCLKAMQNIASQSIDMVLCDLPYGSTNCKWDSLLPLHQLWNQYERICRGPILLFGQTPFDKVLGMSNIKDLRYEWIWEKSHASGHLNAKRMPMKAHENILVFYKKNPTFNPIKTKGHARKVAIKRGDKTPIYGTQTFDALAYDSTERYPRDVLNFSSDKQTSNIHPTQKPVALCEYLIRTYTNENEIVLDNCMGSGTTGIACVNLGRSFVGIEKDASYFLAAQDRINVTLTKATAKSTGE